MSNRTIEEELAYANALVDRISKQCVDYDGDLRRADWEISCMADELAFWKFQAVWHRALVNRMAPPLSEPTFGEQNLAQKELNKAWQANKAERIHAEEPREIGS